ncbi:MAG TPA: DUF3618 domain-containing protein, partial [Candidatus Binatia bacterium]|nr:DUF3618 domain-containing protein [Candidatus Binatia bacterium]
DETRADLGETVDALARKFSPGELLDRSLNLVKEHGGDFAVNLREAVKHNPVALLLTGVGLAWLMSSSSHDRDERWSDETSGSLSHARQRLSGTGEQLKGAVAGTGEQIKDAMAGARDRISGARASVTDSVTHTAASTKAQAARARDGFNNLLHEEPLIAGVVGIAVGALLGAALPRTEVEDRYAGSASDAMKSQVKEKTRESYEQARDKAEKATGAAGQALSESQASPNV